MRCKVCLPIREVSTGAANVVKIAFGFATVTCALSCSRFKGPAPCSALLARQCHFAKRCARLRELSR